MQTAFESVGDDERLDHVYEFEVAVELVQSVEPELRAVGVRVAAELAKVFHHHQHLVAPGVNEMLVLSDSLDCDWPLPIYARRSGQN